MNSQKEKDIKNEDNFKIKMTSKKKEDDLKNQDNLKKIKTTT